eukprot:1987345-Prymnesium_polylepis.1
MGGDALGMPADARRSCEASEGRGSGAASGGGAASGAGGPLRSSRDSLASTKVTRRPTLEPVTCALCAVRCALSDARAVRCALLTLCALCAVRFRTLALWAVGGRRLCCPLRVPDASALRCGLLTLALCAVGARPLPPAPPPQSRAQAQRGSSRASQASSTSSGDDATATAGRHPIPAAQNRRAVA